MADIQLELKGEWGDLKSTLGAAAAGVQAWGQQIGSTLDGIENKTENLSHLWRALFEAAIAGGIVESLHKLAQAAEDVHNAMTAAANSAANFGKAFDPAKITGFVNSLATSSVAGVASIQDLYSAVQTFAAIGLDTAQIERSMAAAANLAAANHMQFGEAVHIVRLALTGHVELLTRYGIISREVAKGIKTNEEAMEAIESATKHATDKLDKGTIAFGLLRNASELLAVHLGSKLSPLLARGADLMDAIVRVVDKIPDKFFKSAASVLSWASSIAAVLLVGPGIKILIEFLIGGLTSLWGVVRLNIEFFGGLAKMLIGPMVDGLRATVAWLTIYRGGAAGAAIATQALKTAMFGWIAVLAVVAIAIYEIVKHWDQVRMALERFKDWLINTWGVTIIEEFAAVTLAMAGHMTDAWKMFKQATKDAAVAWHQTAMAMKNDAVAIWDAAIGAYHRFIASITGGPMPTIPTEEVPGIVPGRGGSKQTIHMPGESRFTIYGEPIPGPADIYGTKKGDLSKPSPLPSVLHNILPELSVWGRNLSQTRKLFTDLGNALGPVVSEFKKLRTEGLNPFTAIMEMLIEKSRSFHLIIEVLSNIIAALSRIIDAVLLPIIKTLNSVLTFVVNIFVELWNGVAAFLNLLGIHVYYLKKINSLFGNLDANVRPLLDIIHDLPTISEYKSGSFGQLTPDQFNTGINQLQNGLVSPLNKHTSILQALAGAAILLGVLLLIANGIHGLHLAIATAGNAAIVGLLGSIVGLLAALVAKPSFAGFTFCPEVDQMIETRERGFVRAGDLSIGDYLRDPEDGWNRVNDVAILPTVVYRFTTEVETIGVNEYHRVMDVTGEWVEVRNLRPGDKIKRYPEGELIVRGVVCAGAGKYASINCDRHRYVLGTSVGHNDSGQEIVAALHKVAAAHRSGGADGFRGPSTGVGGSGSHATDNSTSFVQNIDTINVGSTDDLRSVRENLAFDAERLFRTRQYGAGSY